MAAILTSNELNNQIQTRIIVTMPKVPLCRCISIKELPLGTLPCTLIGM